MICLTLSAMYMSSNFIQILTKRKSYVRARYEALAHFPFQIAIPEYNFISWH